MNERTRSEVEQVLVWTIMIAGIVWVLYHETYICDFMHSLFQLNRVSSYSHCFIFVVIPLLIGLILYSSPRMVRFLRHRTNKTGKRKNIA